MTSAVSKSILKLLKWQIVGNHHPDVKKKVVIAGPHTSNWDFPLGVMVRSAIEADIKYVGKAALFKPPLGWIMTKLGGIGVDRSRSNNFVQAVVDQYNKREALSILFAPEGSRSRVEKFKTGFYHVARLANIPILPIVLDYKKKEFKFLPLFYTTENRDKDISDLEQYYDGVEGYNPEDGFYLS